MPSAAFIEAASAANRQPVALLAIESVDAIKRQITTKTDWLAASPVNINALTEPGKIFLTTDDNEPYSGSYTGPLVAHGAASPLATWTGYDGFTISLAIETPAIATPANAVTVNLRYSVRSTMINGSNVYRGNPYITIYGRKDGGAWNTLQSLTLDGLKANYITANPTPGWWNEESITFENMARGTWEFKISMTELRNAYLIGTSNGDMWRALVVLSGSVTTHTTRYLTSGSIASAALDLGLTPSDPSRFEADDIIPVGCTITYSAQGSDDNSNWTSLGAIADGEVLAPYRYYKLAASLTSNGISTPLISELRIVGGNSQYTYFSTHTDTPIQGAKPYIAPGGVGSLSSKIDLTQPSTVGELTIKLFWTREVGDMIATGYLKNKTIICKIGFVGLSEVDYEPYFVGTWYDYQADHEKRIITVKTRNILKRFSRKIPAAEYFLDATGKTFNPPKLFTLSGNVAEVMLQIADQLGVPDRFIDRASFTVIASGLRSGAAWNISRSLTEPTDARELLNELGVSAGIFIIEGPDGRMTAQLDETIGVSLPVATLDALHHRFRAIDGGQKELFTRQTIYYQLLPGKEGGSASDYAKGLVYVNAQAEVDWQESATKEWMDKWGLSVTAIQMLAQRWDTWFSTPLSEIKAESIPPRFWDIKPGQIVAVDNLQFPCPAASWQGYTTGTRYMVMSKSITDPTSESLTISLDLKQVGVPSFSPDPDFPVYTPFDFYPAVRNIVLSERLVRLAGGAVDTLLDIDFDRPQDFHYGAAAIWSRADGGAWAYKGQTDLGGPEDARVFSFPVTDGTVVEVAVLTVNAAGQTMPIDSAPKATKTIIGKIAPPANVTGFHVTPIITGGLRFAWSAVADVDVSEYVIRYSPLTTGASWFGASEVIRSSALYANLNIAQAGTYFIKALDTTGHESLVAASVVVSTILSQIAMTNHAIINMHPTWPGGMTNFVPNGSELWAAWTMAPPEPGEIIAEINGQYDYESAVDFGEVRTVRLSAKCDWYVDSTIDFDLVADVDAMASFDGETGKSSVIPVVILSMDGVTWLPEQPLFAGDYTFRAAQFGLRAYELLPDAVKIKTCTVSVDLHDTVITL